MYLVNIAHILLFYVLFFFCTGGLEISGNEEGRKKRFVCNHMTVSPLIKVKTSDYDKDKKKKEHDFFNAILYPAIT